MKEYSLRSTHDTVTPAQKWKQSQVPAKTFPFVREGLLVVAGLGQILELNLGGRLLSSEVVLLVALPFLIASNGRDLAHREVKQFFLLAGLWLFGAIFTDAIRETRFEDLVRGWSRIGFLTSNFMAIYLLILQDRRRLLIFFSSIFLGGAIKLAFFWNNDADTGLAGLDGTDVFGTAWRFGYGHCFTFFSFLLSVFVIDRMTKVGGRILQISSTIVDLALQARNLFGIAALAVLSSMLGSQKRNQPLKLSKMIALIFGIAVVGWLVIAIYSNLAMTGALGRDAQDKYLKQSAGSFGLILGGRTESFASTQAILDSPIIGHGSWARDSYYVMLMVQVLEESGYETIGNPFQSDLIPSHSMLLGAWVEAGVLGAAFWFWAFFLIGRGFISTVRYGPKTAPIISFILLSGLWDIIFSPFGLDRRLVVPAYLVTAIMAIRQRT